MLKSLLLISLASFTLLSFSQEKAIESFLSDSALIHSSVSICIADAKSGNVVVEYNPELSLTPASVMKLITSASALKLLGSEYTFKTIIGYTGSLNKSNGTLNGDIIIRGGGDPALGSPYFTDHYDDFLKIWTDEIIKLGIKKLNGRVICDDSYYDFRPVPAKWLAEDEGNYYGAGVYGLSFNDNTYEIHFDTRDTNHILLKNIVPVNYAIELRNRLKATGSSDEGYIFSIPYSTSASIEGTIPANMDDFILKGSITDPPLLIAKTLNDRLVAQGLAISGNPTTVRADNNTNYETIEDIVTTVSPPLSEIIRVLNHESVNLYAEHLLKELGKKFRDDGSTVSGLRVINEFLENEGIRTDGLFMEDGSGLSPTNAVNARTLVNLLLYMQKEGKYFNEFYASLPDAGKNGTLKYYFKDPVFDSRLKAKSGSMTRVRSYAGYIKSVSGKNLVFAVIVNNFTGPSLNIISGIEEILKETILQN